MGIGVNIKLFYSFLESSGSGLEIYNLVGRCSPERQNRVNDAVGKHRCSELIFSELLLRYALMQSFDINDSDIKIIYSKKGKPSLEGYENIHFNISHSWGLVVCAIDDFAMGVDIEHLSKRRDKKNLEYCSPAEIKYINNSQSNSNAFWEIWTRKESYLKAVGIGLINDMSNICTAKGKVKGLNIISFKIDEYIFSLCSKKNLLLEKLQMEKVEPKTIIEYFS